MLSVFHPFCFALFFLPLFSVMFLVHLHWSIELAILVAMHLCHLPSFILLSFPLLLSAPPFSVIFAFPFLEHSHPHHPLNLSLLLLLPLPSWITCFFVISCFC